MAFIVGSVQTSCLTTIIKKTSEMIALGRTKLKLLGGDVGEMISKNIHAS